MNSINDSKIEKAKHYKQQNVAVYKPTILNLKTIKNKYKLSSINQACEFCICAVISQINAGIDPVTWERKKG